MLEHAISELILQDKKRIFTLDELQGVNLVDRGVIVNRLVIHVRKNDKEFFLVERPTEIDCTISADKLKPLENLLREKQISYIIRHLPPNYTKGQGDKWLYELNLDCGYCRPAPVITLVDFGWSYGKIAVNGIVADISHSGVTGNNGTWIDSTNGFHMVGPQSVPAMQSLIESMKK